MGETIAEKLKRGIPARHEPSTNQLISPSLQIYPNIRLDVLLAENDKCHILF